jgi:hypothetical protein
MQPFENARSQEISSGWRAPAEFVRLGMGLPARHDPGHPDRSAGVEQTEDEERLRRSTRWTPQIG